jgi:hypothetical protein
MICRWMQSLEAWLRQENKEYTLMEPTDSKILAITLQGSKVPTVNC